MTAETQRAVEDGEVRIISGRRLCGALVAGFVVAGAVAFAGHLRLTILVGWAVAATVVLVTVWRVSWPQDADGTKHLAEDEGRTRITDTAVLVAAVVSLVGVLEAIGTAGRHDAVAVAAVVLAVVDTILSWALVNTVFALKYARLYYEGEDGGIDFPGGGRPAYSDFAYMAFTVGMSFSVAETQPASSDIRKVGLGHALLSYVFGTVLLAVAVSLLTNL